MMMSAELEKLIEDLETRTDLTAADLDGVALAMSTMRPDVVPDHARTARRIDHTDGAMLLADLAFPNWTVNVHGQANDRDGHWRCTLREGDARDNDRWIGAGRSPILSQAILAALLRLMDETRTR